MKPRRPSALRALALLAGAAASLPPAGARAGVEDMVGLDPRDIALGGSVAARPVGYAGAYYNPAVLSPVGAADAPGFAEVSLGFLHAVPRLRVTAAAGGALPTAAPVRETSGAVVGGRFDVGHAFRLTGLTGGFALYLPSSIFAWSVHPDDHVQWLFHTDRAQHLGVHLALAYRILPWLSAGVSVRTLFAAETFTTAEVESVETNRDPATGAASYDVQTRLGEEVRVFGRAAPGLGLMLAPHERVQVGVSYRAPLRVDDWGWTRIQGVPGTGDIGFVHRYVHYAEPHQATVAVAAQPLRDVSVSVDLVYTRWSDASPTTSTSLPGRFGDTFVPAVGVSWRAVRELEVRAGYRFVRSPFESFGGPTNLLDNDQHVASLGAELELGRIGDGATHIDIAARFAARMAMLVEREETKDPRRFASDRAALVNPGWPGYSHGGSIPGVALSLEARF